MIPFIAAGLLAGAALLVANWLAKRSRRKRNQGEASGLGSDSGMSGFGSSQQTRDAKRAEQAAAAAKRAERVAKAKDTLVKDILAGDVGIAQQLLRQSGEDKQSVSRVRLDPAAIRRISQRVSPQTLRILSLANKPVQDLKLDLEADEQTRPVDYPTRIMEPRPLEDLQGIAGVVPEDQILDDDLYYIQAVTGGLHITQAFEKDIRRKRVYLLLDISPSMDEEMVGGFTRRTWALGLAVRLLVEAMRGDAEYLYRPFYDSVGPLSRIDSPEQAQDLMDRLSVGGDRGDGTNIARALQRAAQDIRSSELSVDTSDVLLISDGQDNNLTEDWLRELLGADIRLHVALLGPESAILKSVATDYMVYS